MMRILTHAGFCAGLRAEAGLAICMLLAGAPAAAQEAVELRLTAGESVVLDYPEEFKQISTTDEKVVDASPISTKEILLNAKGVGTSTVVVWSGTQRMFYRVTVALNTAPLERMLRETFPGETLDVRTSGESVSLNGTVSNKDIAERAVALAAVTAKTVVNNLHLAPEKVARQVLLHVKIAQVDRSRAFAYGINFQSGGALNFLGSLTTAGLNGANIGGGTAAQSSSIAPQFGTFTNLNLGVQMKALEDLNILQVLSEPTLVTTDGKEGSFLVGGEVPVPVVQGGNSAGAVTTQYREFGVRLRYTPQVTANDTIKLALFQELSSLDYANGTTISNFLVPAMSTRRTETNVEMREGETFVLSGLLSQNERETMARIPGISSIPILGKLFKNKQERKDTTELVMMVTPEFTTALGRNEAVPDPVFPNTFLRRLTPEDVQAGKVSEERKTK
jgi:pilus assembly protein CpaC